MVQNVEYPDTDSYDHIEQSVVSRLNKVVVDCDEIYQYDEYNSVVRRRFRCVDVEEGIDYGGKVIE